jgi:hypothetical protein
MNWMAKTMKYSIPLSFALLTACSNVTPQPANPSVTAKIVHICTASGFFKVINGIVVLAYPVSATPIAILNAGIDKVCTNPEKFSSDLSTVDWLLKNMPRRQELSQTGKFVNTL